MLKVIIAGGRKFSDYEFLQKKMDKILQNKKEVEIVSGTAIGADQLGEKYAESRGLPIKKFPADWDNLGRKAGPIRNEQMAQYADACVCFWDGKSRGTKNMIGLAEKYQLDLRVILYQE